jgi:hypothetical protein
MLPLGSGPAFEARAVDVTDDDVSAPNGVLERHPRFLEVHLHRWDGRPSRRLRLAMLFVDAYPVRYRRASVTQSQTAGLVE